MAITIDTGATISLNRISNADSLTGWSLVKLEGAGGTPSVLASVGTIDSVAEGVDAAATRTNRQRILFHFTISGGVDFTSGGSGTGTVKAPDGNIYAWGLFLAAGALFTKANGGIQVCASSGTNRSFWNVDGSDTYSGGFKKWATNTGFTASETAGTGADLGDVTEIGIVTDVGANVTRFDNFVVDAIDIGLGLTFQGTTDSDSLFAESATIDAATAEGILFNENDIIFCQGNIEFSGTAQTSDSETLVFIDTLNGAYTYDLIFSGTHTLINSQVSASGAVDYNPDTSTATSFTMNGGGFLNFLAMTLGTGQNITNAIFQNGGTSTIDANLVGCVFNKCGIATINVTAVNVSFIEATGSESVVVDDLAKLDGCSFTKAGTNNHAVRLTSIGTGTMVWDCSTSGYDAGSTGSPVTPTSTSNEDIFVDVGSGTLTISVAAGATTPSIRSAGATINVSAGLVTVTFTGLVAGGEFRIYDDDGDGNQITIGNNREGVETLVGTQYILTHSASEAGNIITAQYINPGNFEEDTKTITLGSNDQTIEFNLKTEENV